MSLYFYIYPHILEFNIMPNFFKRRIVSQETLGERLKKVREGRDITFRVAEKATGVRSYYLQDLENGNYLNLPGEIYVSNFLKAYAGFLGLNVPEVLEQYAEEKKSLDYELMTKYVAGSHDLFGNRVKPEKLRAGSRLRSFNLFQVLRWLIISLLAVTVLGYLGFEFKKIITPPDLTVSAPVDNLVIQETSVDIIGQAAPGSTVMINDQEVSGDSSGRFKELIGLRPGFNEIKVSAQKKYSREAVIYRRVMVKTEP